jgi:hypothetical protein
MKRLLAVLGGVVACALLGAPTASAQSAVFGDSCVANRIEAEATAFIDNNGMNGALLASRALPEHAWVITRWKVAAPAGLGPTPQQLAAFKEVGSEADPLQNQLIGESATETVAGGAANEFSTRIPVPELAEIGLRGPAGALVCGGEPNPVSGVALGAWALGETRHYAIEVNLGVPVVATIEPDRDGDGYGDETQDGCPSLAAVHTACPVIRLVPKATVRRRGILLEVGTGDPARVEVAGQVGWGYRPRGGGPAKRLIVGLPGSAQEVAKGATASFWLPLPSRVTGRLAKLSTKEKLKAHLTIVATDVAGRQTVRELTVRLPGWAKQRPPGRHTR